MEELNSHSIFFIFSFSLLQSIDYLPNDSFISMIMIKLINVMSIILILLISEITSGKMVSIQSTNSVASELKAGKETLFPIILGKFKSNCLAFFYRH